MVGKSSIGRVALIALILASVAASIVGAISPQTDSTVSRDKTDYSGFSAMTLLGNGKWCSNQPDGAYCEDWSRSCNQITSVPLNGKYWAYLEIRDVLVNGAYDYRLEDYVYPPQGGRWDYGWPYKGSSGGAWLCNWIGYDGFSNPAGNWRHSFRVVDNLHQTDSTYVMDLKVSCNADSQCASGQGCVAGECRPKPDLTPTDLRVVPEEPLANNNVDFVAFVKNVGTADASEGVVNANNFYADGGLFKTVLWTGLRAGSEISPQAQAVLTVGSHAIRFVTDAMNVYDELREDNNEITKSWNWKADKPDLLFSSVEVNPDPPVSGEQAVLLATIKEAKGRDVLQRVVVDVFIDGSKDESYNVYAVPSTGIVLRHYFKRRAGSHTVRVIVDSTNLLDEDSESNNEQTVTKTWLDPAKLSQNLSGLDAEYHVADNVSATIKVTDLNGAPVSGAGVTVKSSFAETKTRSTDAGGNAFFSAEVWRSGMHYIEVASSKQGYSTAWQKHSFKVIDYNARVHVSVHDPAGNPIYRAKVYRGGELRATTKTDGTAYFMTDRGYNNIAVQCPDAVQCDSRLAFVENTTFLDYKCTCRLGEPATIVITGTNSSKLPGGFPAIEGKPIVFAQIAENEGLLGLTGPDGALTIPRLSYGNHTFWAYFCIKNEDDAKCNEIRQTGFSINHQGTATYRIQLDASTLEAPTSMAQAVDYQPGGTVLRASNYTRQAIFIPLIIAAVWVYLTYEDAKQLDACASEHGYQIYDVSGVVGNCWMQTAFLAMDLIPGVVYEKAGASAAARLGVITAEAGSKLPAVRFLPKIGEVGLVRWAAESGTWRVASSYAGKAQGYTVKLLGSAKMIVYDGVEYAVRLDDKATATLINTELGRKALLAWDATAQKGLAQIIDYTNQNVLKRMQLVFDADILLETSQAAGKGIFKPNEVPAQTVAEMLRKSQREGYGLLTGKNLATNEIKEELKVIRISHAPTQTTKIGEQKFKGVANLRYGKNYPDGGGFGFVHAKEHWTELAAPFDLKTDDDLISLIDDAMQNMASAGDIADPYRFYYRQEGKPRLRIVMSSSSPGSFQTLRIDPE